MSHTPQKFITVPLLVEAVQYDGLNATEIELFTRGEFFKTPNQLLADSFGQAQAVPRLSWVVRHSGRFILLSQQDFEEQYTPFREELKDYPASIINP